MLPAKINPHRTQRDGTVIEPGSWWRLVDQSHDLASRPAPPHGLILMVSEARVVDGVVHTVVLHQHPLWMGNYRYNEPKLLAREFLDAFVPEPEGEALREAEIAAVMGRVNAISDEMRSPPDPMALLEAKQADDARKARDAREAAKNDNSRAGATHDETPTEPAPPA